VLFFLRNGSETVGAPGSEDDDDAESAESFDNEGVSFPSPAGGVESFAGKDLFSEMYRRPVWEWVLKRLLRLGFLGSRACRGRIWSAMCRPWLYVVVVVLGMVWYCMQIVDGDVDLEARKLA
jgi:hypothetical protein